jgi:hypothetical protein
MHQTKSHYDQLMRRVIHRLEEQCRELEESTGPVVEIVKRKSSQHTATATTPSRRAALRRAKKASRHTENATDIDMQDADLTALSLVPDDPETISKTSQSKPTSHTTNTEAFIVVKLNGIIFSDDRIALRDIARQLNVIPDGRGFVSDQKGYRIALTNLVSLPLQNAYNIYSDYSLLDAQIKQDQSFLYSTSLMHLLNVQNKPYSIIYLI